MGNFFSSTTEIHGDFSDRLNYFWTVIFFLIAGIVPICIQIFGTPIECWFPAAFNESWSNYGTQYCLWDQNTYYLPMHKTIPQDYGQRRARQLSYYQLIPYFMFIQAMSFYIPWVLWKVLGSKIGIKVPALLKMASDCKTQDLQSRLSAMRSIARRSAHRQPASSILSKICGCSGSLFYLIIKLLFCLTCIQQIANLNTLIGASSFFAISRVFSDMFAGKEWESFGNLPSVIMCDFEVRVLSNVHHHTVQCVLPINIVMSWLCCLLYLWLLLVFLCNLVSLFFWLIVTCLPPLKRMYVSSFLKGCPVRKHTAYMKHDIAKYLKCDSYLLLRLIASSCGEGMAQDLVNAYWVEFSGSQTTQHETAEEEKTTLMTTHM